MKRKNKTADEYGGYTSSFTGHFIDLVPRLNKLYCDIISLNFIVYVILMLIQIHLLNYIFKHNPYNTIL